MPHITQKQPLVSQGHALDASIGPGAVQPQVLDGFLVGQSQRDGSLNVKADCNLGAVHRLHNVGAAVLDAPVAR